MKIAFTYDNNNYELEFTANSIKTMDKQGFDFVNMDKHPITLGEDLFIGSFIAHHPTVSEKKRREIYEQMKQQSGSDNLTETLVKMAADALQNIIDPDKGNITWEIM